MNLEKENLNSDENKPETPESSEETIETPDSGIDTEKSVAMDQHTRDQTLADAKNLANVREDIGLEQPTEARSEINPEKEARDKLRGEFQNALESGSLTTAEAKLIELKDKIKNRELDHKSGDLFRAYRENKDIEGAKRMIPLANGSLPQKGRRDNLVHVFGVDLAQIEIGYQDPESEKEIEETTGFREAVLAGQLDKAETWFLANLNKEKYNDRWKDHRSHELFEAYLHHGQLDKAKEMLQYCKDENSLQERTKTLEKINTEQA